LNVVGHSHDLVLWGRIDGYRARDLEDALYRRRTLFEWGGNLQIRPTSELPHLRIVMQRTVAEERWRLFAKSHAKLIAKVLRRVEESGPLGGRDFESPAPTPPRRYRGGTDATQALYYLWLAGEVMVSSRRGGAKLYDLTSRLFPRLSTEISVPDAEEHLVLQTLQHLGLATSSEWLAHALGRIGRSTLRHDWKEWTGRWRDQGLVQEVDIPGWNGSRWVVSAAAPDLEALCAGNLPRGWRTESASTDEEAVLLSPLEITTARGRAGPLFDFEYLMEAYKPASKRRWGYYTLPILWGDSLPARIDLRFDRSLRHLRVLGFWPETPSVSKDTAFAAALGKGLAHLGRFHGATTLNLDGLHAPRIERAVRTAFRATLGPSPAAA